MISPKDTRFVRHTAQTAMECRWSLLGKHTDWYRLKDEPKSAIHRTATVSKDSTLSGAVMIGEKARIVFHSIVSDFAWIGPRTIIDSSSVSDNASIGADCTVKNATIRDNAELRADAVVHGGVMNGRALITEGKPLVGEAIYIPTISHWTVRLVRPGVVTIGCQTHPIKEWLKKGKSKVPWDENTTPAERRLITSAVLLVKETEKLRRPWG